MKPHGASRTSILLVLLFLPGLQAASPETSCVRCHSDASLFDPEQTRIVESYAADIHAAAGLSCQDCHGGNPDPATAEDPTAAMDKGFRQNPYRGAPMRAQVPRFCGTCHSDPDYMKKFRPDLRVDQEQEYWTSRHGQALKKGDEKVATCIDCHGVHGIRSIKDGESKVFPRNVADTCGGCHSDAERMKAYRLPDGSPLPTNQNALWKTSVHGQAMLDKQDLSAPTCNDCHGNHGAVPPGVESVSFVCGQCHGREASLFRKSAKHEGFSRHSEYLAENQGAECTTCHELPPSFSEIAPLRSLTECATCHGNHGVVRPSITMLGPLPATPCDTCHNTGDQSESGRLLEYERTSEVNAYRNHLLDEASTLGFSDAALYDWMVDRTLEVPFHIIPGTGNGTPKLKSEFNFLFEKFRIGKMAVPNGAGSGSPTHLRVRCNQCHSAAGDESAGGKTAREFLKMINTLSGTTAAAERAILKARRGGVETRPALADIDQAVASSIELQVLVHSFDSSDAGAFSKKYAEGLEAARKALEAGDSAIGELKTRRQGLLVSLGFIGLVLVGLHLKIRQIG